MEEGRRREEKKYKRPSRYRESHREKKREGERGTESRIPGRDGM